MAHWREAVDVYEHDESMLGLDNIVRLETILGDKVGYDAYHRINSATEYLGEWLEQGLLVREAADGARRTAGSGGVPLNWIRGRLDEWIRTSWRRSSRTTTGTSREEGTAAWSSSSPDFISESYVEWKAGLLSEGDLERTDRADTDPLDDPRAFGETAPTR